MMTLTMPITINAGQFLAFTALALLTGAAIGYAIALNIFARFK